MNMLHLEYQYLFFTCRFHNAITFPRLFKLTQATYHYTSILLIYNDLCEESHMKIKNCIHLLDNLIDPLFVALVFLNIKV